MKIQLEYECTAPDGKCVFTKNTNECIGMNEDEQAETCCWLRATRKPADFPLPDISILKHFPSDLQPLLTAKLTPDAKAWFIKPATFLTPPDFAETLKVVSSLGGKYVSAGKESHFEIARGDKQP